MTKLRIGLIGAGSNMKSRHIPGFRAVSDVEIVAVCNRRRESSEAVARDYDIPNIFTRWEEVIASPDIDAVVIGTYPNLHCPITLAALEAEKHVLTEARLAMNAAEGQRMLAASQQHPKLVCQIVPSPFGLRADAIVKELIAAGYLGELREVEVRHCHGALWDPAAPLTWRQDAALSGVNMLTLGILYETLLRWAPAAVRVMAQTHSFIAERTDPATRAKRPVGTPDSVQVLAELQGGARASFHLSGAVPFGQAMGVTLRGTQGAMHYDLLTDKLRGGSKTKRDVPGKLTDLSDIPVPSHRAGEWHVEAEFVQSIRQGTPVLRTNFQTGVQYMEFTEAVARSAASGQAVALPLASA